MKHFFLGKQKVSNTNVEKKVLVICPTCKSKKELIIESKLNQESPLTTISLPKGFVCQHHFQMFIDNNYKVRGYQKVDLELEPDKNGRKEAVKNDINTNRIKDESLLKNFNIGGNNPEHYAKEFPCNKNQDGKKTKISSRKREMSLEEIYEEFWEFINDDNETFRGFIEKDKRRKRKKIEGDLIGFNNNLDLN